MVRAAAGNLPEQNQNNKCVNRPPGTAVKKYAGTYDLPCTFRVRKYDFISALAQETATEVVKNRDEWMKYLTTAARLYKYPFNE